VVLLLFRGDVYYSAKGQKRITLLTETDISLPVGCRHEKIVIGMQYCDHQM